MFLVPQPQFQPTPGTRQAKIYDAIQGEKTMGELADTTELSYGELESELIELRKEGAIAYSFRDEGEIPVMVWKRVSVAADCGERKPLEWFKKV